MKKLMLYLFVSAVLGALLGVVWTHTAQAQVSAQFHWGEQDQFHRIDGRRPLEGRRYQTMASLAHYLDEQAQDLNEEAYRAARRGDRSQRSLLPSISDFARRAHDFHFRMDSTLDSPWDLGKDVADLTQRARKAQQKIVAAHAFESTSDNWHDIKDVLGRMQQLLAGADVEVPEPHRKGRWLDGEDRHREEYRNGDDRRRDGGPGGPPPAEPRNAYLAGAALQEFRNLARELDQIASRAVENVRNAGEGGDRRLLDSIRRFSEEAGRLNRQSGSNTLDPREIRPAVESLLEDAKRTNQNLRQSNPFQSIGNDWNKAISVLDRMLRTLQG
jgi:hypothetical protein